jgi:hypothetical protein
MREEYLKIKSLWLFIHIKALGSSVRGGQVLKWNSTSKLFVSQCFHSFIFEGIFRPLS